MSHKTKKDKTPFNKWTDVEKEVDGAGARRVSDAKKRERYPDAGARSKKGFEDGHAKPEMGARKRVR
jgi:hypothetical protein